MNTKNLFRVFPLISFFIALLAMIHFFPQSVGGIIDYLHDPDIDGSKGYLSLYYITILIAIVYIPAWLLLLKEEIKPADLILNLFALVFFPLAIGFSQWLWEVLGWIVMGFFLFIVAAMAGQDEDSDGGMNGGVLGTLLLAFTGYLGFRIFSEYKALYDILLIGFYGVVLLSGVMTKLFVVSKEFALENAKQGLRTSKMVFYYSVPVLLFLFFAGLWVVSSYI
ncbi:MAG: hypothetical protein LBB62_09610 [Proteiniphilum sp.]|jgi:hypothetical protein|nr:hypothetical protein [Proteiniphilum sp.]